jgi:hypothetical protein
MSNKAILRRLSILSSVILLATAFAGLGRVEAKDDRIIFDLTGSLSSESSTSLTLLMA